MKKRIICLIFVLLAVVQPVCAGAVMMLPDYLDVKSDDWFFEDVMRVSKYDYMQGIGDRRFDPQGTVTRGMAVTMLGRMFGVDQEAYLSQTRFVDVDPERFYGPYVGWADEVGLTKGVSEELFAPDTAVSREEMATFFFRYVSISGLTLKLSEQPTKRFQDVELISGWAAFAMEQMRLTGILRGDENNCCHPQASIKRAEAAAMVSRLISASGQEDQALEALPDLRYVIHAGGKYSWYNGSNSLEAMHSAYEKGNRVLELDFNYTSDGYLACVHDWDTNYSPEHISGQVPPLELFLQQKVYGVLTPMWIGDVAEYMREHPDLYIVTDVKDYNVQAAEDISLEYPDLVDRFIVQIYAEEEYDAVRAAGFENIIFTLYGLSWNEKTDVEHLVEFALEHELLAYTLPAELCGKAGYVEGMLQSGIPLLVHTVNDLNEQERYFEMGIRGIYTDNTVHK